MADLNRRSFLTTALGKRCGQERSSIEVGHGSPPEVLFLVMLHYASMREAVITLAVLVGGAIIGAFIKPNADQLRPIEPEAGAATADDHQGHH